MNRPALALLARTEEGCITLSSPAVGIYSALPVPGEGLVAGSRAGVLRCLGRTIDLIVPEGAEGRILDVLVGERSTPVEYAEPLIVLAAAVPAGVGDRSMPDGVLAGGATRGGRPSGEALAGVAGKAGRFESSRSTGSARASAEPFLGEGLHALRAPTAGVFYSRSDPASPAFVSPGSSLETGQTAALIEVMKVFSPIIHPGGAIPSPAIVVEVRARDGEEVSPGQVLFVLGPR